MRLWESLLWLRATEAEDVCHLRLRVTPVSSICVLSCCYGKVIGEERILQIIMSGVTQPNWFSPSSSAFFQSSAVTQVAKSGKLGEGCHDVSVKFLTAAYNR